MTIAWSWLKKEKGMEPTSRFTWLTTAWLLLLVLLGGLSTPVHADSGLTTRVSVDSAGTQANGESTVPTISANGRFVSFESVATNLVADDTSVMNDIFMHDLKTGETTRVSVNSEGGEGNGGSQLPKLSADGRSVVFISGATNLVAGDTNGFDDVFVHDRRTGTTTRVSVNSAGIQANNNSDDPTMSADGRFVAFNSAATNLVAGDTNGTLDAFVHDRRTGTTTRVSVDSAGTQANGDSFFPALSANGRFVAFVSGATNLVADDTSGMEDVFVHDRRTGTTTRVNVDSAGTQANGDSIGLPSLTADGRSVAFSSEATNLVAGDTNGALDIFVHDRLRRR
jgi:Tol biopolymer transport system component